MLHQLLMCLRAPTLWPWLPERTLCLQTKRGTKAKSVVTQEFADEPGEICRTTKANWETQWGTPYFMYDNPSFHQLDQDQKNDLTSTGGISILQQLQNPPPYSGDFMQLIEHAHAIVAQRWFLQRLLEGAGLDIEKNEEDLRTIAMDVLTAGAMAKNIEKLQMLLHHVVKTGTGDYVLSALT